MYQDFEVSVQGQLLRIPYRIHEGPTNPIFMDFAARQAKVLRLCNLTRHYDGFIRERFVKEIITFDNPMVAPYLIRLCGEYVVEILDVINLNLDFCNQSLLRSFILENPEFYAKNRSRMISYWDCYYRFAFPRIADYVGFKIFMRLDEIAQNAKH